MNRIIDRSIVYLRWVDYIAAVQIVSSVINDLSTDQRVDKTCRSLMDMGHEVKVFCRSYPESIPLHRPYGHERMELIFRSGPFFYAEFNVRLFFKLLRSSADVIIANDLDTLLASRLAARVKEVPLIYDSHEYFTEVPELQGRWAKKVWSAVEKRIFPKLRYVYTVNRSIADIYAEKYGVQVEVLRNLPSQTQVMKQKGRLALSLPEDKHILILQGAGINVNRGGEELIDAMGLLSDDYLLLLIGSGDVYDDLVRRAERAGLSRRIRFIGRLPYRKMMQYTCNADLGLTLDKDDNLNYRYSLPNKIFDYIAAGIPVLSSDLPELRRIITEYEVGVLSEKVDPQCIAETIRTLFSNPQRLAEMRVNTARAREELKWENEVVTLEKMVNEIGAQGEITR